MKKHFYVGIVIILALSFGLVAYGGYLNYNDEHQIANLMEERSIQLTAAKAEKRYLRPTVSPDAIKLYSESMTDAVALIDGRITKILVAKNSAVRKGDKIMTLMNEQIPMQIQQALNNVQRSEATLSQSLSNVQRMEALLAQATSAYLRQQRLMARNATAQEKVEAAEAEYKAAQEAVRAAEAECDAARASIRAAQAEYDQYLVQQKRQEVLAPIDGDVLLIYKREGAYVQGGTPLVLIGDFNKLLFSTTLENVNANHLAIGDTITLNFNERSLQKAYDTEYSAGNLGRAENIRAEVREITPPLEEDAVMRRVLWSIDNSAHILEPLTYTGVTMQADNGYECLTVPLTAMTDSEHKMLFVVGADGVVERRAIEAGANDGTYIEVINGLKAGEVVVLESFEGLDDGVKVAVSLEEGER